MNAKEYLKKMIGDTTYITTRGTGGDADCEAVVDDDVISEYGDAVVIGLDDAPQAVVDDVLGFCRAHEITASGISVAQRGNDWIVVW